MIIAELDIKRPFLIRPFSAAGNNIPNVNGVKIVRLI